ncbi:hypothetical protein [Actinoplanes subglobosus]|uniref:Uncharacterized protein n=1 Tax=Actinoplanes subglobosus TaxID=1547892 RepID=A0ABV8ISW9_9ACTN
MTVTSAETTNIEAARTFLTTLAAHLQHLRDLTGTNHATLAGRGLDATTLDRIDAIRGQLDTIAGTCASGAGHLTDHHAQMEQAVNNTPEAADTDFYRPGTTAASGGTVAAPGGWTAADAAAFLDKCIGPRQVGGRYYSGYWGEEYTVTAIDRDLVNATWSITEATDAEAAAGRSRTHHTPWEYDRDRVVAQPATATNPVEPAQPAAGAGSAAAEPAPVPGAGQQPGVPGCLPLGDGPHAPVVDWSGGDITGPRILLVGGDGSERAVVQMRRSELAALVDALDDLGGPFGVSYNEMSLAAGGSVRWDDWDERQDGSPVMTLSVSDAQGGFGFVELIPAQVADLSRALQRQLDADGEARDRAAGIKPGEFNPDDLLYDDEPDTYSAAAQRHRRTADWYAALDQNNPENASQKAWFTKAADTLDAAAARQAAAGQEG